MAKSKKQQLKAGSWERKVWATQKKQAKNNNNAKDRKRIRSKDSFFKE